MNENWFWAVFMIAFLIFVGYCEYCERRMKQYYKDNPDAWRSWDY